MWYGFKAIFVFISHIVKCVLGVPILPENADPGNATPIPLDIFLPAYKINTTKQLLNEGIIMSKVLCVSNAYEKKYYLSSEFAGLPQSIKEELQIMCVLFTEDIGGILTLEFEDDGSLFFATNCDEGDILYDEIGSVLKVKQLRNEKFELLDSLEMYYRVVFLGEPLTE